MSLLDVIGPVMVGPSSSHTAGACRIALLARHTLLQKPQSATICLHGSFAKTGKGHGTHLALIAGVLGFFPDDSRIPDAYSIAEAKGLQVVFSERDLGDLHPNTVQIELKNETEQTLLTGSSLGGGVVKVIKVREFDASFSGSYYTLLIEHEDKPGVIARVARVLADDEVNVATIFSARQKRGGRALMSIEVDKRPEQYAIDYLARVSYIRWLRVLPEVMTGSLVDNDDA